MDVKSWQRTTDRLVWACLATPFVCIALVKIAEWAGFVMREG
jgi:hypothetical protein